MRRCLPLLATIAALLGACARPAGSDPAPDPALIADGRAIAEANCARCHAIGADGESAAAGAPAFRTLSGRVRFDVIETEFAEGLKVGHAGMPEFAFDLDGVDALMAYLKSVQDEPQAR